MLHAGRVWYPLRMATLTLDAESLATLLTTFGPPHLVQAQVAVTDEWLVLQLEGVQTGIAVLGKKLGRVDAEVRLQGRRVDDQLLALTWQLGRIAGIPGPMVRLLAPDALLEPLLRRLLSRIGLEGAVTVDGRQAEIRLDRLPDSRAIARLVRCQRFDLPGPRGQALSASFTVVPAAEPVAPAKGR